MAVFNGVPLTEPDASTTSTTARPGRCQPRHRRSSARSFGCSARRSRVESRSRSTPTSGTRPRRPLPPEGAGPAARAAGTTSDVARRRAFSRSFRSVARVRSTSMDTPASRSSAKAPARAASSSAPTSRETSSSRECRRCNSTRLMWRRFCCWRSSSTSVGSVSGSPAWPGPPGGGPSPDLFPRRDPARPARRPPHRPGARSPRQWPRGYG